MNFWWYLIPFLLVPILVHLFDFRKTQKVYFSTIKYIANLTSKSKSKSRLRYFLILSNRILFFLTLLALIWILLDKASSDRATIGSIAIYYDNSESSTLNDSHLVLEQSLDQLSGQANSIFYYDNLRKSLLNRDSGFDFEDKKSLPGTNMEQLFNRMNEAGVSSYYLFSDYQSVDPPELAPCFRDSTKSYQLVLTNDLNKVRNVYVDSLYLRPNPDNLSKISILVDFNVFNMPGGSIVVKLMQGSRQLSSIAKDVTELDAVQFDVSKNSYGEFEIVIDGDDVNFDNIFHFNISKRAKPQITILNSKASGILNEVYRNQELFEITSQDVSNLDYESLTNSDLIVVSDQFSLPVNLPMQLKRTQFIVFPSDTVDISSYENFFDLEFEQMDKNLSEIDIDSKHPLFKGVFESEIKSEVGLKEIASFRINGDFETIIEFRGGNLFLLKKSNTYLFNSPIGSSLSGFQSSALFLPILYQIAFSSSGSIETPYHYPGDRIDLMAKVSDIPVRIKNAKYEVIPSFNTSGSQVIVEVPDNLEPGKYVLMQNTDTLQNLAINFPKEESVMRNPGLGEMKNAFSDMENVRVSQIVEGNNNVVFAGDSQSSLWKYALILAVFLILTETVLHRYLR